ncbi:Aldo/keto reductase [Punctularia strigosozonata HHB-11173 SS5]|uniref:Aldo/keto reductase n=1 Tax=Punctularia strigosozonata (strain HHB-11173) TaxID=741275 RepID=UPI000441669B|nr:Aldo/keto reductase [Punctularia strigosozonata HHB-11173 SS5]EIN10333.1 Aldo/keto reductase [Punctularia strigosozonata HHB-11173 SS5]
MVSRLDAPQPVFAFPPLDSIPDGPEDNPVEGKAPSEVGALQLPELIFGAAPLNSSYNKEEYLESDVPLRTVRLALRYGIKAFDTSAYYGPSEIVLGTVLKSLEAEFPRLSYKIMTKCGRYGPWDFDYSPATIRASVMRSLERLNTPYLDVVFLHDLEFVATPVPPPTAAEGSSGRHALALTEKVAEYGLEPGSEGKVWGEGDQKVLDAIAEMRKMQDEGLIKNVGIAGYPLPTLLRIALLVLHKTGKPLDALLSYSHLNLQNQSLLAFAPALTERAKISQLVAASPLNMGLLTGNTPTWHPAPQALKAARDKAIQISSENGSTLPDVALGYAYRLANENGWPMIAGLSTPDEVHASVKAWRAAKEGGQVNEALEKEVRRIFDEAGYAEWSWSSPDKA